MQNTINQSKIANDKYYCCILFGNFGLHLLKMKQTILNRLQALGDDISKLKITIEELINILENQYFRKI
ncbi:hypothetical protein CBG49_07600 [Capnocytophaga endodontalis]|uniref:Uncharacterized protein n=1 Tax=Capnocytophaga endodontalis TaxID=2708117 RepID=A0A1Z4BNS7_9FLAO|nr:hypothetical protein CBG49_07600 [Capnocytophaga endodontalis]